MPGNPFLEPTPENCDLSFLTVDDDHLVYAVEHYDHTRRLRESYVLELTNRRDRPEIERLALVEEASAHFRPEPWMLPVEHLKNPGVINGIVDYFPINETTPEIYDQERRAIMNANGQRPWLIMTTLNSGRHTAASFMHWVEARLVPSILKSAREMAELHFREGEPAAGAHRARAVCKSRIRPALVRTEPAADPLSPKRLRQRLHALACHRIRHSALPGESMTRSLARYREALPESVHDPVNLDGFIRRVDTIAEASRTEWLARLGDARRLRAALDSGRLHLVQ